jgi:selenide,water dikinase
MTSEIKLTHFSKGGGCGCKIDPSALQKIVKTDLKTVYPNLLVGNESNDDAAVFQIDPQNAIISTTDFFMPIVDDPFDFGRIASANAISDVYAMGGKPLMAIAILGWPIDKIPGEIAKEVLDGSRTICNSCNIPLAGGHTINSLEPIFGLAVTGTVRIDQLKRNNTAKEGDLLFLTKRLGVGILTTAIKRGFMTPEHYSGLIKQLTTVNRIGEKLCKLESVHAMTDVTGFGLIGHLYEMAEGSGLSAEINLDSIKLLDGTEKYIEHKTIPGATSRNWRSFKDAIHINNQDPELTRTILADPQTNGGILFSIAKEKMPVVQQLLKENELEEFVEPIGSFSAKKDKVIYIH